MQKSALHSWPWRASSQLATGRSEDGGAQLDRGSAVLSAGDPRDQPSLRSAYDSIRHIDRKWRNNLIESDSAAMKRLLGYRQNFRSLRSAKATLSGVETVRTIKRGHIHHKQTGFQGDILFINRLFQCGVNASHRGATLTEANQCKSPDIYVLLTNV